MYYEIASEIEIPTLEKLQPNTNDEGISDYLTGLTGIGANRHVPDTDESRQPLAANIKHTEFYLFQPQSTIANKDILFYRQQEPFLPQTIKDTLPYLLGVVQENRLQMETDLRNAKRNLRLLQKQLQEAEQITGNNVSQGQSLLVEAQQVGLISNQINTEDWESVISALQNGSSALLVQALHARSSRSTIAFRHETHGTLLRSDAPSSHCVWCPCVSVFLRLYGRQDALS